MIRRQALSMSLSDTTQQRARQRAAAWGTLICDAESRWRPLEMRQALFGPMVSLPIRSDETHFLRTTANCSPSSAFGNRTGAYHYLGTSRVIISTPFIETHWKGFG
jgi:hypothetical protein